MPGSSFGSGGQVSTSGVGEYSVNTVAIQSDDRVLVAGYALRSASVDGCGCSYQFEVARYLTQIAYFTASPFAPLTGESVTFTSTANAPQGDSIDSYAGRRTARRSAALPR